MSLRPTKSDEERALGYAPIAASIWAQADAAVAACPLRVLQPGGNGAPAMRYVTYASL